MMPKNYMKKATEFKPIVEKSDSESLYLHDYTSVFLNAFKSLNNRPVPCIMNVGGKGSGKTAEMFIEISLGLNSDLPNPIVAFWKAPPNFIQKVQSKCPEKWKNRFVSVKSLNEVNELLKKYSHVIFCMDEASRDMNAKQATTRKSRQFEKAVTLFRQKNVLFIYNTQIGNVTLAVRELTEVVIYRGHSPTQIRESDDSFAKLHKSAIVNLYNPKRKKYCYFQASWSELLDNDLDLITEGRLTLDVKQYCAWYDDELSKGYSEADLDHEFGEEKKENEDIQRVSKMFLDAYPGLPLKMATRPFIEGWLRREHLDIYHEVQGILTQIYADIRFKMGDDKYLALKKSEEDDENDDENENDDDIEISDEDPEDQDHPGIVDHSIIKEIKFPKFASEKIPSELLNSLFHFELSLKADEKCVRNVLRLLLENGSVWTQVQLAQASKISNGTLHDILKKFRNMNFRREMGYILEDWWVSLHGGSAAHNGHGPDWIDPKTGEIWSFKFSLDYAKSIKFYQNIDSIPEYEAARAKNSNYKMALVNPAWGNEMQIVEVNPFADLDITFSKPE